MPARRLAWVTHASKFVRGGSSGTIQPVLNVSATYVKLHASTVNFEILMNCLRAILKMAEGRRSDRRLLTRLASNRPHFSGVLGSKVVSAVNVAHLESKSIKD